MISISDKARAMLLKQGGDRCFVRVTVTSGGCAGMTYNAELASGKKDEEKIILKDDQFTVITNEESIPFLFGLKIDYSDDLISAGYRFSNASNESSCGCGASFAGSTITGFPKRNDKVTCGA